jgi:hypothetical protein
MKLLFMDLSPITSLALSKCYQDNQNEDDGKGNTHEM